jgi:choline kinase
MRLPEIAGFITHVRRQSRSTSRHRELLKSLAGRFRMGIVSNFYGNLENILAEFDLASSFGVIADSSTLGVFKPEPGIFNHAIRTLGAIPAETAMVGASLAKDCDPAHTIGITTIWLGQGPLPADQVAESQPGDHWAPGSLTGKIAGQNKPNSRFRSGFHDRGCRGIGAFELVAVVSDTKSTCDVSPGSESPGKALMRGATQMPAADRVQGAKQMPTAELVQNAKRISGLSGAIIAAGRGERLRTASGGIPKPLVELGGEPLLVRQAHAIAMLGAYPVHAIVNSETARMIRERDLTMPPAVQLCVRDTANSMESLLTLGEHIAHGRFLMTTVDAVVPPAELERFAVRALELTDPVRPDALDGALGVVKWRGDRHPLFAEVALDGTICALGDRESRLVTAGVYLFSTRIFSFADKARATGLDAMRRYLALLIGEGIRFAAIELSDVIDVDEAVDLDAARALVASQGARS